MTIENWRLFVQERLRAMDPSINLDTGSPASVQVVEPIVSRLSPDPIDTDVELFILTRLRQEYPELYAQEGSAMADLFAKPARVLIEPLRREFKSIRKQLSLDSPNDLTTDEADSLMKNFFMTRNVGGYARVRVRICYQNAVSVNIGSSNIAYTANGLRFFPTHAQSITAEGMLFNVDSSGLYYFDVTFVAERPGTTYNIGASQIIGVTGLSAATRATNLAKATPGTTTETTPEFIDRGERSIGERSNNTLNGLVAVLRENYPHLSVMQAIGFNDEEMNRDVIKGGSLGPILYSGTDGDTTPDGASPAGYTYFFDVATPSIDFTTTFGPVGEDISGYSLTVWYDGAPHEFDLKQVEGATRISISDSYARTAALADSLTGTEFWCIRKKDVITLSDIPGGILFPDSVTDVELTVPHDEIHVGGCVDIYVRGGDIEDAALDLSLVSDESVIARKENAQTTNGSDQVVLIDLTTAEWDQIVAKESSLYLEEGGDLGAYRIIQKMGGGAPGSYTVRLSTSMTAPGVAANISYLVVDDVDIDLVSPREMRYEGSDLRTVAGLATIDTVSGVPSFTDVGVVDTDYVRILNGDDAGEYSISAGGVAAGVITLATSMTSTASPLQYEIYRKQDGIERPLLRVKTVELLDSNLDPTGAYVPYRHPVDIRSNSFQNPGREPKAGTTLSITVDSYLGLVAGSDIAGAVDDAGAPLVTIGGEVSWFDLGVRVGDIVNINDSGDQGYYTVTEVGGAAGTMIGNLELRLSSTVTWTVLAASYTLGPPSYGSFRLYFLDPVTFWATYASTLISVTVGFTERRFRPDPDIWQETVPTDTFTATGAMTKAGAGLVPYEEGGAPNVDLWAYDVEVGDRVEITYAPLVGNIDFATAGPFNLDGKTILLDLGSGDERITFSGTSLDLTAVVAQINAQASRDVAFDYNPAAAPAEHYLGFRGDLSITIRDNTAALWVATDCTVTIIGNNRAVNNPWLAGTFVGVDTDNDSPDKGYYLVDAIMAFPTGELKLATLTGVLFSATSTIGYELGHYFHVARRGMQRISSTAMLEQGEDEHGLYYVDLECISEGHGNTWNIAEGIQGTATGYGSEGWDITTDDEDTSFSTEEEVTLHMTPRILVAGVDDDPLEKEELVGTSIQVDYDRDPVVEEIQTFIREPQYRVLNSNPLVRSLLPIFVRTNIEYRAGGTESDIRADITDHIESVLPSDMLEVDDLAQLIRATGGTKVTHPVTLLGIAHQRDRSITTERSVDQISNARLSALIPDDDGTTDEGASFIRLTRTY